jgi:arylsulfatase A-like enzyme
MLRCRRLLLVALVGVAVSARAADRPHVYVVVIDGLDARFVTPERMPRLLGLRAAEPERTSVFLDAHGVMPARTNPNHVTLLTGVYAEAHGVTGNQFWSRKPGAPPEKTDAAGLIEVETLFTVAEETRPSLVTWGVFAKPKLGRLFAAVPGRQRAPDSLWSGEQAPSDGRDSITGYSRDSATMDALLALADEAEPDLVVANLADVDRTAHRRGPDGEECARAVAAADAAIGRLVDELHARGRWARSVLIVTADHGFTSLVPTAERPNPVIALAPALARDGIAGVHLVADGGVEHVYADAIAADATEAGGAASTLGRVATLARSTTGVAEVLARLPVPDVPAIAVAHPGWHLQSQRAGDLLLVAAPGYEFVDPAGDDAALRGNHGAPGELRVPLVVTGGSAALRAAPDGTPAPVAVDVAPTVAVLLGLRLPRRVNGDAVPEASVGHVMRAVLAEASPTARTAGSN